MTEPTQRPLYRDPPNYARFNVVAEELERAATRREADEQLPSGVLADATEEWDWDAAADAIDNWSTTGSAACWIGAEIYPALLMSEPPRQLWLDSAWPRTAMLWLLPLGPWTLDAKDGVPKDAGMFITQNAGLFMARRGDDILAVWIGVTGGGRMVWSSHRAFTVDEFPFDWPAWRACANATLLTTARPDLVERREKIRSVTFCGVKQPLWEPRWLGRKYRIVGPRGNGTHASPRMHWRNGHWRAQVHGAGRKDRKLIWLEPTLVNAADGRRE